MTRIVEAAAAVILQPDGRFLLGRRPEGKPYAGYWEFPGGKIEPGETAAQALVRELHEELGIEADRYTPWITREFVYPHAHVRLHFFRVAGWHGEIRDIHHAALAWRRADNVDVAPLLPANLAVLRGLTLPDFYAITHAGEIGVEAQLKTIERALSGGLRLLQIREPQLSVERREAFAREATRLAHAHGARVLVNSDIALARHVGADGVHLPSAQLMHPEARPDLPLVAASCHNAPELARAAALELDFAVLGPLRETLSHPGANCLGWERFAHLLENLSLPVYALGGMRREDMAEAQQAGAHGIAAIRAAWD
ncbi:MAG: DNA mismatch repair protein MutT [Betaproteobacteria bacterium HGW-Betaproteobacteria-14]|nr:MAG: DNA mismatch repair protein MutT [Betaproteobacteria bacterium HGW-Betaproteobacteria-14]PKO94947.1 MAG: DNA mismatch repair protein MutT [Betaproteobacteria bacterium HGW-Betaproteobacteria-10]